MFLNKIDESSANNYKNMDVTTDHKADNKQ